MSAIWKPIPGYEGFYSVSELGLVRAESRQVSGKLGSIRTLPQRVIRTSLDSNGYPQVCLCKGRGSKSSRKVHVLVALTFLGPRPIGMEVAHGDGVRSNASLRNLRYATKQSNHADRLLHGTRYLGSRCARAKLNEGQINAIRLDPRSHRRIAADYGVAHTTIGDVKSGNSWFYVE